MTDTNKTIPGCGFHHVAIRTSNWERSMKFWCEGLGFVPRVEWGEAPRRAVMLNTGDGNYLEVFERDPEPITEGAAPAETEPHILHFCFRVANCDEAVEKARAAGGEVTAEPRDPEVFAQRGIDARIAFIKGPDGEICEFFQTNSL